MRFRVGLNPYGLTYTLGLQGQDTPRANPGAGGLEGFIAIATEIGAKVLEIYEPWLARMNDSELQSLRSRLADLDMTPVISAGLTMPSPIDSAFRSAEALGAKVIRLGLTPVLEGARAAQGECWPVMVDEVRAALRVQGRTAANAGVSLAIENHQDFGSAELVAFCEDAGPGVGITFDTGNAFPVAEAPLDFARTIAPHVRHVHLKDYRVQFTDLGFRLVRWAIGDGAVPVRGILDILGQHHDALDGVIELAALQARHIRLFTPEWWRGYAPRSGQQLAACLAAARVNLLPEDADYRTPWELGEDSALETYERDMLDRSVTNLRAMGLI